MLPSAPQVPPQGTHESSSASQAYPIRMGLGRGLGELRRALFAAGPEGVPLGGRVRMHRALPFTATALLVSVAAALGYRALALAPDPRIEWYNFGFLDARWLVLGYWLCVASALFVPLLVSRARARDEAAYGLGSPREWS